jgi:hypothetical protein
MALSGSFQSKPYSWMTLKTDWSATQNVANNTSTITCTHYLINTGALNIGSRSGSCNAGGDTKSFTSSSISSTGTHKLGTTTHTIKHNDDGTKSINFSVTFSIKATLSGVYRASITASGSATLNTIPRASGVTCNSFYIGDSTTINISRASSNFTHTVKYVYGNLSGTIATKTKETSLGWTAPTEFYGQIPNGTTGYGSVICETYNGDTLIGTKSTNFNAYAKINDCFPEVRATIRETDEFLWSLTGDDVTIIKHLSKPKVTITSSAKNYATIKTKSINWSGENIVSADEHIFSNGVTSPIVSVSVTDSRGYASSQKHDLSSYNSWVEYVKLAFSNISMTRPESTSSTVNLKVSGNYFNGSFGAVTNDFTLKYRYRAEGGSYGEYITVDPPRTNDTFDYIETLENIDYQKQYYFEFVLEDKAMYVSSGEKILEKGEGIFRIGQDYTRTNGRILDGFGTELSNGLSIYRTGGVDIDPNTTLEELILTETNTPTGGFWYVKTMFYANKSTTTNRTQVAYPYAYDSNVRACEYMRTYVAGTGWSKWALVGARSESGWVTITPIPNSPTAVYVAFKNTYNKIPSVVTNVGSGVVGTQVLGSSTNGITTTGVNIVVTRTNATPTTVYFQVQEEV